MRSLPLIAAICAAALGGCGATIGWQASHHSRSLPHASCGTVMTHLLSSDTELLSASPGALGCFDAAVRSCSTASLHVTEMGVDGGAQYVFAIQPAGRPCQVAEFSQSWTANFGGGEGPVVTTTCRQVVFDSRGVMLRCPSQQYLIPAAVGPTRAPPDGAA